MNAPVLYSDWLTLAMLVTSTQWSETRIHITSRNPICEYGHRKVTRKCNHLGQNLQMVQLWEGGPTHRATSSNWEDA